MEEEDEAGWLLRGWEVAVAGSRPELLLVVEGWTFSYMGKLAVFWLRAAGTGGAVGDEVRS